MKNIIDLLWLISCICWLFIIIKPIFKYGFTIECILNINIKHMWISIVFMWIFLILEYIV
jgi:hypothetical protein